MSLPSSHGAAPIELKCVIRGLEVCITGPPAEAADLLRHVTNWTGPTSSRDLSPAPTASSFDLVDPTPRSRAPTTVRETRGQIESGFPGCPDHWIGKARKLCGSTLSGEERIRRAWKAGLWAAAFQQGRCASPNRTPSLDLRSRFYAVVRADGLQQPTLFLTANSYFRCVGDLRTSSSISHAFPSELESAVFFDAAGVLTFNKEQ